MLSLPHALAHFANTKVNLETDLLSKKKEINRTTCSRSIMCSEFLELHIYELNNFFCVPMMGTILSKIWTFCWNLKQIVTPPEVHTNVFERLHYVEPNRRETLYISDLQDYAIHFYQQIYHQKMSIACLPAKSALLFIVFGIVLYLELMTWSTVCLVINVPNALFHHR